MEEDFKLQELRDGIEKLCQKYDVQTVLDVLASYLFDILRYKAASVIIVNGKEERLPITHPQTVEWSDGKLTIELK